MPGETPWTYNLLESDEWGICCLQEEEEEEEEKKKKEEEEDFSQIISALFIYFAMDGLMAYE